ncbi:MAG: hypothetical protein ACTHMI_20235 [Mucilaginibacter sp.]
MKRVEVTDLNDLADKDWLFKFKDEQENTYFIMGRAFYEENDLVFPITRLHLEAFLPGVLANVDSKEINGKNIVTKVYGFLANATESGLKDG